jgi:tRNA (cytosine38-C5)-methyltransferase
VLDHLDNRSKGLLHLVDLLSKVKNIPQYLFLENVPNFENSECRKLLIEKLQSLGFQFTEYLVSPLQFGIPNDRRRYYLAAKRLLRPSNPGSNLDPIVTEWPNIQNTEVSMLYDYLETDLDDITPYVVPENYILPRDGFRFDIVQPSSVRTSTVTKAYGSRMITRSGSLLQTKELDIPLNYQNTNELLNKGLRYLTPTEVARLHCFPIDGAAGSGHKFSFPEDVSLIQRWRLLGNSLNCRVVSELLKVLLN